METQNLTKRRRVLEVPNDINEKETKETEEVLKCKNSCGSNNEVSNNVGILIFVT